MATKRKSHSPPTEATDSGPAPKKPTLPKIKCLPSSVKLWEEEAARLGVETTSINNMKVLEPGSSISEDQFLTFRTIWLPRKPAKDVPVLNRNQACQIINQSEYFARYYAHVESGLKTSPPCDLGAWQMVRDEQQQVDNMLPEELLERDSQNVRMGSLYKLPLVSRTISEQGSRSGTSSRSASSARTSALSDITAAADSGIKWDPTDDEQVVNSALLEFLKAAALATPSSKVNWSMRRLRYKVAYNAASMETRTDGFLGERGIKSTQEAFAIVEAKAHILSREEKEGRSTYFQKSAEMLNWIMRDQKHGRKVPLRSLTTSDHSRLLIAQSRHEIFLVIARYDDEYISYQEGGDPPPSTFMTMQQFGPFVIDHAGHMKYLAEYLVGFYLHLSETMP